MIRTGALLLMTLGIFRLQAVEPTYVGAATCRTCHLDLSVAFAKNTHHDAGKGCESCHGAGSNHAQSGDPADIRSFARLTPAETDRTCLTCHMGDQTQVGRIQSSHAKNQIACTSCHRIHGSDVTSLAARKPSEVNELCSSCHVSEWAQFQKPFTHRLAQGAMSCVDCHNPHGSFRPGMMQTVSANEPGCFKCHGDKRGPFTFEHAPVRFEGCGACHEAHGSANPRMLTRQDTRQVCLECHSGLPNQTRTVLGVVPPAFHDLRSARYRNCSVCHQKVHGSYIDRSLLR